MPEFIDPWRLAEQGGTIEGEIPLARMSRMDGLLENRRGNVVFSLGFSRDDKRRPRIHGRVQAGLALTCQRCLGSLELPVDAQVELAVIEVSAEANRLPEECDPILADDGRVRLLDLLQDELLLAIPQVPMHESDRCRMIEHQADTDNGLPSPQEGNRQRPHPFAVLAGYRTDTEH